MDVMKDSRLRRLWTWPGVELEKTLDVTEVEVGCPGKVENRDGSKRRGVLAGFYTWYQSHGAHTRCDKKNATRTQQLGLFESIKLARRKVKECSKIAREHTKKGSKKTQQKDSKNCVFGRQESRKKSQQEE
ncbi:hypothetical protein Tco_0039494 [Tanacetum coccineum]